MRAFGVLMNIPVSKCDCSGILLPGLLVVHMILAASVVLAGRTGFEGVLRLPGGHVVVFAVAFAAVFGLSMDLRRSPMRHERFISAFAAGLPVAWLWALLNALDYDDVAAAFSATSFGEHGDTFWFPGVPFCALGYTAVLFAYASVCVRNARQIRGLRLGSAARWTLWSMCAVSFAGVVQWTTGW